ncbi:MAG: acyl-CoA dehydrogenase family protein [Pseudomonadales bacterium]|nr:acyl-CoA/acyl-ACP dehydrogenase [Pseudomonadales bacterium]
MYVNLNEEQRMMRDVAEKFARTELMPVANDIDRDESTPDWVIRRCAELGFLGMFIPEAYGGTDAGLTTACVVLEELAKASPAFAGLLSVEMILCPGVVNLIGSEAQKQRLLPPSVTGEKVMAYSQTEPAGAGNVAFHQTRLTEDGNGFRLNGHKLFCTQGTADVYLVMCRTRREGQDGYGCVIVERSAPGFEVHGYEEKLGWRGTNTGPIAFSDISLSGDDVLGDLLTANADIAPINQASFMGHAATSLGCVQGLFDLTLDYLKQRHLYGEPMYRLSPISDRIARIYTRIDASRALLYASTRQYEEGTMTMPQGSVCKAYICDTAFECTSELLQMWGGSGIMNSTGVNRYMRDARAKMIAEGATEMHHSIISTTLGLDRFPQP